MVNFFGKGGPITYLGGVMAAPGPPFRHPCLYLRYNTSDKSVKVSLSLVNGAFGAIGANGDNEWRQWMLHRRQWRFCE